MADLWELAEEMLQKAELRNWKRDAPILLKHHQLKKKAKAAPPAKGSVAKAISKKPAANVSAAEIAALPAKATPQRVKAALSQG